MEGLAERDDAPALPAVDPVDEIADALLAGGVVVLSGAGISTESGIPDYRGPTGRARNATPMTYQEFVASPAGRQRYWARSYAGWPLMRSARPNAGHGAVARLQRAGAVSAVVTQNVDSLHERAGATGVVALHGRLRDVLCLACAARHDRDDVQAWLAAANPSFDPTVLDAPPGEAEVRPDGDVALLDEAVSGFRLVDCPACGAGPLKPDVVFFGENVPKERVERCFELVDGARTLLVLGSSLTVMSGYRFVRHAARRGIDVLIVNQGTTRGDEQARLRVDAPLGPVLTVLADHVEGFAPRR